jgi:hypothetical protein
MSKTLNMCPVCNMERASDLITDGKGDILGCSCDFSFDARVAISKAYNKGQAFDMNTLVKSMLPEPLFHPYFEMKGAI